MAPRILGSVGAAPTVRSPENARSPSTARTLTQHPVLGLLVLGALCAGCGAAGGSSLPDDGAGAGNLFGNGAGGGDLGKGDGLSGGSAPGQNDCGTDLTGRLRDFTTAHPDFEYVIANDPGLVAIDLGGDGKPVYAGPPGGTVSTHGPAFFDQWYRDDPSVNTPLPLTITLSDDGNGIFTYDNSEFFPLDGLGFGDQGLDHNFHFTFELHTKFLYHGGETFRFVGDDDLFAFINGKLVIDLGGVHGAETGDVDLDASAGALGITVGQAYRLDVFFAERHTTQSEFRIDTTLEFVDCGSSVPD